MGLGAGTTTENPSSSPEVPTLEPPPGSSDSSLDVHLLSILRKVRLGTPHVATKSLGSSISDTDVRGPDPPSSGPTLA